MFDWVGNLYDDWLAWLRGLWTDFTEFVTDLPINILDGALNAIAGLLESIPVPNFLETGLGAYLAGIDPSVLYFLGRSGMSEAVLILGAGISFRLLRKLFTLGQW